MREIRSLYMTLKNQYRSTLVAFIISVAVIYFLVAGHNSNLSNSKKLKCAQFCDLSSTKPREWNSFGLRNFAIRSTWDGQCFCHNPVEISLGQSASGDLLLKVDAPFFDSPAKPDGHAGQPFPQLWDYEVVEAFFLNDQNQYLEVELSPHGQHLLLLLNGRRNMVKDKLPLNFVAAIHGDTWTGEAIIPRDYLPPSVSKFNAYAIHGEGDERQYESLYPVKEMKDGMQPDFHRLELFEPLDMSSILTDYVPSHTSTLWAEVLKS